MCESYGSASAGKNATRMKSHDPWLTSINKNMKQLVRTCMLSSVDLQCCFCVSKGFPWFALFPVMNPLRCVCNLHYFFNLCNFIFVNVYIWIDLSFGFNHWTTQLRDLEHKLVTCISCHWLHWAFIIWLTKEVASKRHGDTHVWLSDCLTAAWGHAQTYCAWS